MANFTPFPVLIPLTELRPGMCYSFQIGEQPVIEGFLINWEGQIHAYRNQCPHTGVNLDWAPNQFLDINERFIQCSLHGALFEPRSGFCIHGPCLGQSLTSIPIQIRDGQICLDLCPSKG